jgi:uptake hydrogenase large subunit
VTLEGNIRISMAWDGRKIRHARLEPRPLTPVRTLLLGKRPAEAVQALSLLFSLCGKAQAAAASTALEAAQSDTTPAVAHWRERLVLAEALQELLWRLLLDLPRILHAGPSPELLARLRHRLKAACALRSDEARFQQELGELEREVGEALLGRAATRLRDIDNAEDLMRALEAADTQTATMLAACWRSAPRRPFKPAHLMPHIGCEQARNGLQRAMRDEPGFASRPHWHGRALETGSLARMQHHPLLEHLLGQHGASASLRLLARLLEIDELFSRLRAPQVPLDSWVHGAPCGPGAGFAWVQCARGMLLHRAVLDKEGLIEDYCIVAPTEWNFHPEGSCIQELTGKAALNPTQARRDAELLVHSLDPCVGYEIEVNHA